MHVHLKFQILAQLVDLMIMQSDVKSRTFSVVVPYVVVCFHNAHAFYMTCSRFLLHEPNRKKKKTKKIDTSIVLPFTRQALRSNGLKVLNENR